MVKNKWDPGVIMTAKKILNVIVFSPRFNFDFLNWRIWEFVQIVRVWGLWVCTKDIKFVLFRKILFNQKSWS